MSAATVDVVADRARRWADECGIAADVRGDDPHLGAWAYVTGERVVCAVCTGPIAVGRLALARKDAFVHVRCAEPSRHYVLHDDTHAGRWHGATSRELKARGDQLRPPTASAVVKALDALDPVRVPRLRVSAYVPAFDSPRAGERRTVTQLRDIRHAARRFELRAAQVRANAAPEPVAEPVAEPAPVPVAERKVKRPARKPRKAAAPVFEPVTCPACARTWSHPSKVAWWHTLDVCYGCAGERTERERAAATAEPEPVHEPAPATVDPVRGGLVLAGVECVTCRRAGRRMGGYVGRECPGCGVVMGPDGAPAAVEVRNAAPVHGVECHDAWRAPEACPHEPPPRAPETAVEPAPATVEAVLPSAVEEWLGRLVYGAKAEYARAWALHVLTGAPAPADPGAEWADKARKRLAWLTRAGA